MRSTLFAAPLNRLAVWAGQVTDVNFMAEQTFQDQLAACRTRDSVTPLNPPDADSRHRLFRNLDVHAALLFYCGPKIARKISGLAAADGNPLIAEALDHFTVWDTDEQKTRTLEKVCAAIDDKNKTQILATYDILNKDLTLHFGGTDFTDARDLTYASMSAFGGLTPRAADGVKYAHIVVNNFQQMHPDIALQDVNLRIAGHSSGGATALVAKHVLEEFTGNAVETVLLDPFGAGKTLDALSRHTGKTAEQLSDHVTTVKGLKKGALDLFKSASATIGDVLHIDVKGHMGKHFIHYFHQDRHNRRTAKPGDSL